MGAFNKKQTFAFADIIKGLQHAINGAGEMLQAQQAQSLLKFWKNDDGKPVTRKIQVGGREMEVPLVALVPHNHLEMDDVEIKFKARVGDIASGKLSGSNLAGEPVSHADLLMEMEGVRAADDDVMEITIHFKSKDMPEGLARLTDECNKTI